MKIAVLRERAEGESRVAATPETVAKLMALGADIAIEAGAGLGSRITDKEFAEAGASVAPTTADAVRGADIVLCVRRPAATSLAGANPGALLIGALDPYGNEADVAALAKAGVTAMVMEFMPRITRAQVMDILSSQANLAGYQAVIEAAAVFDRAMPMMMTAAGTVRPAKAFVMGAGVAGLQAIATARRLGAVVSATDVRPAAKEQVESLGGKFIAVEDDEFKQAETAGGYAKQMSADYQKKQAELTAQHIARQDIVITTALIPGRPAPKLITRDMVQSMAPGSVIVDLAAERGGNVELTEPGKVIEHNGVTIVGFTNVQGRIPTTASQLYARNLLAFVETLVDKKEKRLAVDWDDDLVKATLLTRDGAVVHPAFQAPPAASAPPTQPEGPAIVPAMADTPRKAEPGVEQSVPATAEPAPAARKRAATKKAASVIDAAAAASPTIVKKPGPAAHVEDHGAAAQKSRMRKPATRPAEHVEDHSAAIRKPRTRKPVTRPADHIEDHTTARQKPTDTPEGDQ